MACVGDDTEWLERSGRGQRNEAVVIVRCVCGGGGGGYWGGY